MPLQKSKDYKITAAKYYLENNVSYVDVCKIFKCSERSLKRWIEKYQETGEIKRNNRKPVSYQGKPDKSPLGRVKLLKSRLNMPFKN